MKTLTIPDIQSNNLGKGKHFSPNSQKKTKKRKVCRHTPFFHRYCCLFVSAHFIRDVELRSKSFTFGNVSGLSFRSLHQDYLPSHEATYFSNVTNMWFSYR